jgi:hypothetical protein
MKRLVLIGACCILVVAACGGGGASDQDQIKQVFTSFFSAKTPVSQKPAMLQDGARFKSVITDLASNPLAARLSAKVSSVTLQGSDKAKVVFSIYLGSAQVLKNQVDSAYKVNGKWLVGYAGLCKLIALEGSAPAACKQ